LDLRGRSREKRRGRGKTGRDKGGGQEKGRNDTEEREEKHFPLLHPASETYYQRI